MMIKITLWVPDEDAYRKWRAQVDRHWRVVNVEGPKPGVRGQGFLYDVSVDVDEAVWNEIIPRV